MSDLRKWKALVESASKLTEDPVQDADYTDHEVSMAKSQMLSTMKRLGMSVDKHHHEVASCQHELGLIFSSLTKQGAELQKYK